MTWLCSDVEWPPPFFYGSIHLLNKPTRQFKTFWNYLSRSEIICILVFDTLFITFHKTWCEFEKRCIQFSEWHKSKERNIFLSCDAMITKNLIFSIQVSLDGNVATTTVIFIPEVKDQDKILYCRAKNLHVSTKTVEDQWKIKVACKL